MSINLPKARTVFFPEIPRDLGQNTPLYLHFTDLQDELNKQVVGLFDNDAVLRDALNTAVSVAVTATGDMVYATGAGWGVLSIGAAGDILISNAASPYWSSPTAVNIVAVAGATTGGMAYFNATTGWAHLAIGDSGQELLATATGPAWTSKDANIVIATGGTSGGMIIHSAGVWVPLGSSAPGTVLTMGATMPGWAAVAAGMAFGAVATYLVTTTGSFAITGLTATPKSIVMFGGGAGVATLGGVVGFGVSDGTNNYGVILATGADNGGWQFATAHACVFYNADVIDKAWACRATGFTATGFTLVVTPGATYGFAAGADATGRLGYMVMG